MANIKDFATALIATAPSPANSGTSLVLDAGMGARMPAVPFAATIHPEGEIPTLDNAEKVNVTNVVVDTLTIQRAQGQTTAKNIGIGWRISNAIFASDLDLSTYQLEPIEGAFVDGDKTKLDGIEAGAQVNTVTSVNTRTGAVTGLAEAADVTTALAGKQDKDPTLTALAAHNTNGILTQTAADTFTGRTITGTANQITVTNGDGVAGNPTLSLPQDIHTGASPTFAGGTISSSINAQYSIYSGAVGSASEINFGYSGARYWHMGRQGSGSFSFVQTGVAERLRLTTGGMIEFNGNVAPFIDSTYSLGTSGIYWSNTYTDKLFLNSTATLDGSTAGVLAANGKLKVVAADSWPFEVNNNSLNTNFLLKSTIAASTSNRVRTQYQLQNGTGNASALDITAWFSDITPSAATSTFTLGAMEAGGSYSVLTFVGRAASLYDGVNISVGTSSGTKIGTATNQKLGFYNATPVVQPSATPANATDLATALTLVNDLKSKLVTLGLIA